MLDNKGDLASAEIAFFSFAIGIAILIFVRQGFKRQLGLFYVGVLAVLQILGASCLLYSQTRTVYNTSILEISTIASSIGSGPLLLALMGFLQRINANLESRALRDYQFHVLHLLSVAALILGVVGGIKTPSSDPGTYDTGHDLFRAASILFLAIWLALTIITVLVRNRTSSTPEADRPQSYGCLAVAPFILVRIAYTMCTAFAASESSFSLGNVNILAQVLMRFLMDAIAVTVLLTSELLRPTIKHHSPNEYSQEDGEQVVHSCTAKDVSSNKGPSLKLLDYRPSKLIRSLLHKDRRY